MWAHGNPGMHITWKSRVSLSRADCGQAARRAREELPHSLQVIFSLHSTMRLAQDQLPAPLWKSIFSLPLDLNWLQTSKYWPHEEKILQASNPNPTLVTLAHLWQNSRLDLPYTKALNMHTCNGRGADQFSHAEQDCEQSMNGEVTCSSL